MTEDIYEPLPRYRDEFRAKFADLTRDKFQQLLEQSQVDWAANRRLNGEIQRVRNELDSCKSKDSNFGCLLSVLIVVALLSASAILYGIAEENPDHIRIALIAGGALGIIVPLILIFQVILPKRKLLAEKISVLKASLQDLTRRAWEQMEPLNKLFDWNITAELIKATVPRLEFDPYFSENRLLDLYHSFGWNDKFNHGKSVINSHSGVINDNPFVFGELKTMQWQEETYSGSKHIHWTTRERGSDGKMRTVHHSQQLVATYTAPKPFYYREKVLLYGNDAAPELHFSREPSDLSADDDGFFASLKKHSELRKLKKLSRNLEDDLPYTLMSNHDFELLFHATDRNDDVAFRLLFTPLAQQQMVRLLNDRQVGCGDDFYFHKMGRINMLVSRHLNQTNLNTDPQQFRFCNVDEAREFFQRFNEEFFHSVYFALAPLLTIPLYQQTRTTQSLYNKQTHFKSCFWEHEAIANFYGDKHFKHPDCATENILKTSCTHQSDGTSCIQVTAHGYRKKDRVAGVKVWGQDGNLHIVEVPWIEYLPVEHTSEFHVLENDSACDMQVQEKNNNLIFRRSVYAFFRN